MALNVKITVLRDVTPSSLLDRYQRFGGTDSLPFIFRVGEIP
jgi:hypothetical protein